MIRHPRDLFEKMGDKIKRRIYSENLVAQTSFSSRGRLHGPKMLEISILKFLQLRLQPALQPGIAHHAPTRSY